MTSEQGFDELMGPSPDDLKKMLFESPAPPPTPSQETTTTAGETGSASGRLYRYSPRSSPRVSPRSSPRASPVMVTSSSSLSAGYRKRASPPPTGAFAVPDRWAHCESSAERESASATAQAITSAREKAAQRDWDVAAATAAAAAAATGNRVANLKQPIPLDKKISSMTMEHELEDSDEDLRSSASAPTLKSEKATRIRQEALKLMEVTDNELKDSAYSVHRTATGGFTAQPKPLGSKKRVPTALAGLDFSSSASSFRRNANQAGRSLAEDPYATSEGGLMTREDFEYGEEDVASIEQKSLKAQKATSNNWSSRYSVNNALLSIGGHGARTGTTSKLLDRMDQENEIERRAAKNISSGGSSVPQVFGTGGFSFRKKHVFGKQQVTVPVETNLREAFKDDPGSPVEHSDGETGATAKSASFSSSLASRAKSWNEQLQIKRRQQYICIASVIFALLLCGFFVTRIHSSRKNGVSSSTVTTKNLDPDAFAFYVTSDAPFGESDKILMTNHLMELEDGAFLIHLGNIQQSAVSNCAIRKYQNVAELLRTRSPIPTFVLPGQEDWVNCPDPDAAWDTWYDNFSYFQSQFDETAGLNVKEQSNRPENFSIQQSGVLLLGIHAVRGPIPSVERERNEDNLAWIQQTTDSHIDEVKAVVILGSSHPFDTASSGNFFANLADYLSELTVPSIYVHANNAINLLNSTGSTMMYYPFEAAPDVMAVQVQKGGSHPPLRIIYTDDFDNPFIVEEDQDFQKDQAGENGIV